MLGKMGRYMDPERKVPFNDFAQATFALGEASFKITHKHPLLIFIAGGSSPPGSKCIDTPDKGIELHADDTGDFALGGGRYSLAALSFSSVVIVEKTNRNPFETMITVGRSGNNDIILPFPTVSKFHGYFARPSESSVPWRLVDQNSMNGTFIDTVQIAAMEAADLESGKFLTFGNDANAVFLLPEAFWDFLSQHKPG